ncbi:hypothetical protein TNCV_5951 [Trichonephila clavipes]|nr:hypothetical protein TNCV_5951 [Trichonephila clavipes]
MEKIKSSVHPTNFPLFSDANKGSHLPINIDHELSKPQRTATSSMQPCSSISNGGAGLEPRAEMLCMQKPLRCSPVPVFLMGKSEWSRDLRPLNCQMS